MLGEMDFVGTYVQPFYNRDLPLPMPTFCLLCNSPEALRNDTRYSLTNFSLLFKVYS